MDMVTSYCNSFSAVTFANCKIMYSVYTHVCVCVCVCGGGGGLPLFFGRYDMTTLKDIL